MHPHDTDPAEEWRPVVGFEGWYSVSTCGRVRREHAGRRTLPGHILTPWRTQSGYDAVDLYRGLHHERWRRFVHILMAEAFLGPRLRGAEVNHIDGMKRHNVLANLEYTTRQGNAQHAARLGLMPMGTRHPLTRLSDADVLAIRAACARGATKAATARAFGVAESTVRDIIQRRNWRHI